MSEQRNAEIWSTRLQRELLALTAGGADDTADVAAVLPPFITLVDHELDITNGICKVFFHIDVPNPHEKTQDTSEEGASDAPPEEPVKIVIMLDVSLHTKPDGSVDAAAPAYPFQTPAAILRSGASLFPDGSTVRDGDPVDIDCDWTPSLHLSDAVLNVGLKVKESLLQQEPFHAAEVEPEDPVDEMVKSAKRFGSFISKGASAMAEAAAPKIPKMKKKKPPPHKVARAEDINIGDEINLLESPWVDCEGVYSCKAIRRPAFVEDAMVLAAPEESQQVRPDNFVEGDGEVPDNLGNFMMLQAGSITEVAGAGFAGAGAMFRSFKKSAKSVLEESFLMITDTHLIELRSSRLNLSTGTVTFAISIDLIAKLKFRRQESISLFFKPAPDDPLIFMCPDSADAVHQIQSVLKARGVKGKHTNAAAQRNVNQALQIVQEIQAKERALEYKPSVDRVNEIMDLYRQAAELFESAGDTRHEEVVTHMRKFLAMPLVVSILDGSFVPKEEGSERKSGSAIPEGEVLERTKEQLEDDDMSTGGTNQDDNGDKEFHENVDNLLKEAKEDFDNLNMNEKDLEDVVKGGDEGDAIADLDAMLSAADKEIDDIMNL